VSRASWLNGFFYNKVLDENLTTQGRWAPQTGGAGYGVASYVFRPKTTKDTVKPPAYVY
jgi:hypothetical protein